MKIFLRLYDLVLNLARHPQAERYLLALSFAESSFFPVPPDVILAPMTLANPQRGWRLALGTTVASVLGGIFGYLLGWLALDAARSWLEYFGYWEAYLRANTWFIDYGFYAVLIAGFSPVPYKIFTIAAGALMMFFPFFLVASFLGRGARFFLVVGLLRWGGENMEERLRQYVDVLGWTCLLLVILAYIALR